MTELIDWIEYGRRDPVALLKLEFRRQFAAMRGHVPVISEISGARVNIRNASELSRSERKAD